MDDLIARRASSSFSGELVPKLAKTPTHGSVGVSASFQKLMIRAGVITERGEEKTGKGRQFRKLILHSLRHTFNSAVANQGVPIEVRRELTGHSSDAMNHKYTHYEIAPLRAAIEKIPRVR